MHLPAIGLYYFPLPQQNNPIEGPFGLVISQDGQELLPVEIRPRVGEL